MMDTITREFTAHNVSITVVVSRLIVAAILGGLVGVGRERRDQSAGIRTHAMVSLGAALVTLISQYGFGGDGDPARVAAQIVSGLGFLGAGVIILNQNTVRGLTTAAGIWAISGIGMAVGTGMYVTAAVATLLMSVVNEALLAVKRRIESDIPIRHMLTVRVRDAGVFETHLPKLDEHLVESKITAVSLGGDDDDDVLELSVRLRQENVLTTLHAIRSIDGVRGVDWRSD